MQSTFTCIFSNSYFSVMSSKNPGMVKAVVPHMASRRTGNIVNAGSVSAMASTPWSSYAATKATLHTLTNTLRLQLQPLGIDVINVVPGAIKSHIGNSAAASNRRMLEWKLYGPLDAEIRKAAYASQETKSTPMEMFAKKTIVVILKNNPPTWFSYGHYSTITSIMYHLPLFVKDFLIRREFKLSSR